MRGFLRRRKWLAYGVLWASTFVGGCAWNEQVTLDADSAGVAQFSGTLNGAVPRHGRLYFADTDSYFEGHFDGTGFPGKGVLVQHYLDENQQRLSLHLDGHFSRAEQRLAFAGSFKIVGKNGKLLAEGEKSRWGSTYRDARFIFSPQLFQPEGKIAYRQYRRSISPLKEPRQFVRVKRPLAGPFDIEVRYRNGKPRGIAVIEAVLTQQNYIVERQYFNFDIANGGIHYYYFEPGSYTDIALIGECDRAPNLTAPRDLINFYAYDCAAERFLGLSEAYPATVIEVAAEHIDNSGYFHRVRLLHHGEIRNMGIDKRALAGGMLVAEGLQVLSDYGNLRRAFMVVGGKASGIGIEALPGKQPRYVSLAADSRDGVAPQRASLELWRQHFSLIRQSIDEAFADLDLPPRPSTVEKLKSVLESQIRKAPAEHFLGYKGVNAAWRAWLGDGQSLIDSRRWQARRTGLDSLRRGLHARLNQAEKEGETVLATLSKTYCAEQGLELDQLRWECAARPQDKIAQQCQHYFGSVQCQHMAEQVAGRSASTLALPASE